MCPISGMVQFLIVVVTLLLMCHTVIVKSCRVNFKPNATTLHMYDTVKINYIITDTGPVSDPSSYVIYSENEDIASIQKDMIPNAQRNLSGSSLYSFHNENNNISSLHKDVIISNYPENISGIFNMSGNFLGKTKIRCKNKITNQMCEGNMKVIVIRKKRFIDIMFTASVATLVSILYINFGCAMNWGELKTILKRPIGPAIGFFGQFFVMPMLSYILGIILFPDSPEMRLGLFFTGVSPAGGASNVWTVILEGNMSLSIVMTTISTIAAFAMMPLWIFTLGTTIFESAQLQVPYKEISTYVIALVGPLAIGYLIQRYLKRVAGFMARILKGLSSCLILFIIIFAIVTNLYLFQLFSWQIILAGMGLPWLGYVIGYLLGKVLNQPPPDCLAIAIEVGIQNTGIAIFLLRFALPQPQADLTTIAPVSVAVLTPFPLMFIYFFNKFYSRVYGSHTKLNCADEHAKTDNNNTNRDIPPICPLTAIP